MPRSLLWTLLGVSFVLACAPSQGTVDLSGTQMELRQMLLEEELARKKDVDLAIPPDAQARYYFMLGEFALEAGKLDEALKYYETAKSIEKTSAVTLRKRLAHLYLRTGRLEDALAEANLALEANPEENELLQLRAGILAASKETDQAILAYQDLIRREPDNQDYYLLLASLYAQQGNANKARGVLKDLIRAQPTSVFGYYYLARLEELNDQPAEAAKYYQKAIAIDPNADGLQLDYSRVLATLGRRKEAIEICRKLIRDNPNNVTARRLLGQYLLQEKDIGQALEEFESLGKLEDDPTGTRLKIALIKLESQDYQGAEQDLSLLLANQPENTMIRYYLASALASLDRNNDAIEQLKTVKKGERMYTESQSFLAYLLHQEKRYDEALDAVEEALKEKPDDAVLLSFRSSIERDLGQVDAAIKTIRKVIELEPTADRYYFTLGVYLDEKGERREAIAAVRKAIELNPKNSHALNYLGYTLADIDESLDEALQLVKRALTLEKDNGYYIDSLGWIYYKMGRYREALTELKRAVSFVPDDAVILEHLGIVQLKLGKRDDAISTFQKALPFVPQSDDEEVGPRLQQQLEALGVSAKGLQ